MARLLKKNGAGEPEVLELNLGVNRFGRDPENHFAINHPTVSSHHCDVILTAEAVLLRDNGSANGTFINGKRVKKAVLQSGQTVRLGRVELFVETTEVKIAIPKIDRPRPAPLPPTVASTKMHCARHPESLVIYQCSNCQQVMCKACVRKIRRSGGTMRMFCPLCTFPVHVIGEPKPPVTLPDGKMLCPRHAEALATYQCTDCREVMCDACVQRLEPTRGKVRMSCVLCSHPVLAIALLKPKRKTLTSYLKKTVKLPFVRGKRAD